ncbi:glycosyltransferase [Aeromicrobium sp.]|uniref:glycosyltransferase n=1 Tax=Aeromicrobium sp. TaxID=1871063 RepID=UPI003D6B36C0
MITFDPSRGSGLWDRLMERLHLWAELGVRADVAVCATPHTGLTGLRPPRPHQLHLLTARTSSLATRHVPRWVDDVAPDVVYARLSLPWPALALAAKRAPLVLEVHADPIVESKYRPVSYRAVSRIFTRAVLARASGFVFVDPELASSRTFARLGRPSVCIPNGIDLPDGPSPEPLKHGQRPRVVLVAGADEPWQGIPKLAELARAIPEFEFHVIGSQAGFSHLTVHPQSSGTDYTDLLSSMHVGVGNLALEQIGRREPSPLKVREYLRHRLPVAIAHDDPDLNDSDPSLHNFGYGFTVTPEVVDRFREFVVRVAGTSCTDALRDSVGLLPKERARVEFLHQFSESVGAR